VKVQDDPAIKSAEDVAITQSERRDDSGEGPTNPPPLTAAAPKNPKRGFFQSINPLNLFHSDDKNSTRPPSATGSLNSSDPGVAGPASAFANVPRYNYRSPAKPTAGNRTQAQRAFAAGVSAQESRKFSEAVRNYRKATETDPAFYEAYYNLGLASTSGGDIPGALQAYEYALAIQPNSMEARYNFALALQQGGYPADAVAEFEKVLGANPNEARAHLALGNLYAQQLRDKAQARIHYQKVLDLDPQNTQAGAIMFWLAANRQ
jgi:tetratricopeptide (TPR) repeat protein